MMNILYFIHDLAPFGAQRTALNTVRFSDKSRFKSAVCSFWGDETLKQDFEKAGAGIFLLRAARFYSPAAWGRFAAYVRKNKPDIILTTVPELGFMARILSFLYPAARLVHVFQNPMSSEPAVWRFLNKATLGMCAAIAVSSSGNIDDIAGAVPALSGRISVIPNSVETVKDARTDLTREKLGIGKNTKVLGCTGRLTRQKGQDILIDAASLLIQKGNDIKLLLAGDGDTRAELESAARGKGIGDRVLFLGRRNDIPGILRLFDLYAAPSRWESFNIALGEAMAAGVPCVASDISGHKDLCSEGKTASLVRPGDPEALAAAVLRALSDPAGAERMAMNAKRRVETEFTVEKMAASYMELFLKLSARRV